MPLTTGTGLGSCEVVAPIGAGGMGGACGPCEQASLRAAQRECVGVGPHAHQGKQTAGLPRQFATTNVSALSPPAVSRDGKQFVFVSEGAAVVMPVGGGDPIRRIPMRITPLRWTPDDRGLTHADALGTNLWVQPIDGGAPYQLTTFTDGKRISGFAWSPDGKQLALARAVTTSDIVLLKGVR